ncbi:retinol dehydrogenase 12 [Phlyctema vagabunda]|uniref:Retinol dehydrogenase 12 n=1 Tax=Phlyctema vagabunda TaxID=108571 RepID=A0ABR4P7L5_9HELO
MSGFINYKEFSLEDTPSLKDKVAVVTGGNAGIGSEMVAQLLLHDVSKVYVIARTAEKFQTAQKSWKEQDGIENVEQRVEFLSCDLSDITEIKKVAEQLLPKLTRLDILINNAGLPTGIETIWATNVVGTFVLTNLLLELIEETAEKYGDARIVVTSSSFHMGCQELNLDSTMSPERVKSPPSIDSCWRYARSKLGNILFTRELARRLDKKGATKVYANCFFPGNIPTGAMDTWKELFGSLPGGAMKGFFEVMGQSPTDAAATAIYLAASPEVVVKEQKGKYFIPIGKEDKTSKLAEDKDLARNVWYWCDDKTTKALGKKWDEDTQ